MTALFMLALLGGCEIEVLDYGELEVPDVAFTEGRLRVPDVVVEQGGELTLPRLEVLEPGRAELPVIDVPETDVRQSLLDAGATVSEALPTERPTVDLTRVQIQVPTVSWGAPEDGAPR